MNKSVFLFVDTNEEKLQRINYLTNNLINDIKGSIPFENIEIKLEEILQLTRY
jgi:hypothetical protein